MKRELEDHNYAETPWKKLKPLICQKKKILPKKHVSKYTQTKKHCSNKKIQTHVEDQFNSTYITSKYDSFENLRFFRSQFTQCEAHDIYVLRFNKGSQTPSPYHDITEDVSCGTKGIHTHPKFHDLVCRLNSILQVNPEKVERILQTLLIATDAFELIMDSKYENIIMSFANNIKQNSPAVGSPAFNFIADQIKFYGLDNTCAMRYSESTKCIFKVCKGLFGGAALRYLSGWKNETQVRSKLTIAGHFNPSEAKCLLAVPSEKVLDEYQPLSFSIPSRIKPGIIPSAVDLAVKSTPETASLVLKFDGRRIRPGFEGDDVGDVDFAGFEPDLSLSEKLDLFLAKINKIRGCLENFDSNSNVTTQEKIDSLLEIVKMLNEETIKIKSKKVTMERSLRDKHRLAGKDWVNSKYKKIISYLTGLIRKSTETIEKSIQVCDNLFGIISKFQNSHHHWTNMPFVPLESVNNCWIMKESKDTTISSEQMHIPVKQRSEEWHSIRNKAYVTGSTLFKASGLDSLKKRSSLYDKVHLSVQEKTPSDEIKKAMEYGTKNEINAIATICTKVLPIYFPSLDFVEVGLYRYEKLTSSHTHVNGKCGQGDQEEEVSFFSLDGVFIPHCTSLNSLDEKSVCMTTEIKCPFFNQNPHSEVPVRYIAQIQSGMAVTETPISLFVSYGKDSSTVFICKRNEEFFESFIKHIKETFIEGKRNMKKCELKDIRKLTEEVGLDIEFLTEVKSIRTSVKNSSDCNDSSLYLKHRYNQQYFGQGIDISDGHITDLLLQCIDIVREFRQVQRIRATESVTYMLSNTDRIASNDRGHGVQIGYVLAGSSFPERDFRAVTEKYYMQVVEKGGRVPALVFDGQFHKLLTTSNTGEPLTVFQLQKQCWDFVKSKSKQELLHMIKEIQTVKNSTVEKTTAGVLEVSFNTETMLILDKKIFSGETWSSQDSAEADQEFFETECSFVDEVIAASDQRNAENNTTIIHATDHEACNDDDDDDDVDDDHHHHHHDHHDSSKTCKSSKFTKISLSSKLISGLRLFLLPSSKLHSFSDDEILKILEDMNKLFCTATVNDVKSIIKWLKSVFHENKFIEKMKLSGTKYYLVHQVSEIISSSPLLTNNQKSGQKKNPESLKSLVFKEVKTFKKSVLNTILAHHEMKKRHKAWIAKSPINTQMAAFPGVSWCSIPEKHHVTGHLLLHFVDYHHLNIRLRMALLKGSLSFVDINAWWQVSSLPHSPLPVPVLNGADPQSETFAQLIFSQEVEVNLSQLGFQKEANFCKIVRGFMDANDTPGMSAMERHCSRFALKNYLMQWVNTFSFPPPGERVKGMPFQLFEALVSSADAFLQLHALIPSNSYNVRSISTNDNETLHGVEEAMLKPFGGVPSVKQLETIKSKTVEITAILNDPNIDFPLRHARNPTYSNVNYLENDENSKCVLSSEPPTFIDKLIVKNHDFDKRPPKTKKLKQPFSDWWKPPKGMQGIRAIYKVNETKMTMCERMGYKD